MASFKAVLQVGGKQYEILYSDFILHQYVDSLGRPASRTHGGAFLLEIEPPPKGDGLLTGWMFDPAMELNAQVVLWDGEGKMLRVTKLYNAYCVSLEGQFNATGLGLNRRSSLRDTLYISPQAVDINGLFHDNDWPGPSPIIDWDWSVMNEQCNPDAIKADKQLTKVSAVNQPVKVAATSALTPARDASDCSPAETMRLQREVVSHCKTTPTKCFNADSCPILEGKMQIINDCIAARTKINMKCFRGGNEGHKIAIEDKIRSLTKCQGIYFPKCGPKPQPVPAPRQVPVVVPETNPDFIKKMEELTGLTGAALIIYLIISEGSRLFPPRNVIPIP